MTRDANMLLISGVPRSGTTLVIDWLRDAWPEEKIWLMESGLTNLAYHSLRLYEFNAKSHATGIDFSPSGSQRQEAVKELQRWIVALYRLKAGNVDAAWILDKMPVFMHDASRFYQAMLDIFPKIRLVLMIRSHDEVILSMMKRTWARGPFPKLNAMSPFAQDAIGRDPMDVYISQEQDKSGARPAFITKPVKWSFQQCCRNYGNAIRAISAAVKMSSDILVLDYADLEQADSVCEKISHYTGAKLKVPLKFKPRRRTIRFNKEQQRLVREELEETGVLEMYKELRSVSVSHTQAGKRA